MCPSLAAMQGPVCSDSPAMPAGSLLEEGPEATSWLSLESAAVPSPELQQSWDAAGAVPEVLAVERGSPASQGSSDQVGIGPHSWAPLPAAALLSVVNRVPVNMSSC